MLLQVNWRILKQFLSMFLHWIIPHSTVLVDSSSQHHKLHSVHNQDVSSCTQGSLSQTHTQPLEHESVLPCVWLSQLIEIVNQYSCWILDVDLYIYIY